MKKIEIFLLHLINSFRIKKNKSKLHNNFLFHGIFLKVTLIIIILILIYFFRS